MVREKSPSALEIRCSVFLALLFSLGQAAAQTTPEVANAVSFQYSKSAAGTLFLRKTLTYSWGTQVVPNVSASVPDANSHGHFSYQVDRTEKPASTKTQYLVFKFKSDGFFSTGGHFGIVGKAQVATTFLRGRGIIIGKNKSPTAPSGCERAGPGAWVQPETWWAYYTNPVSYVSETETRWVGGPQIATNWVGDGTHCGQTNLHDGITYAVILHIGIGGASYWVYPEGSSSPLVYKYYSDAEINRESTLVDNSTGYAFLAVFGGLTTEGLPVAASTNWTIRLTNIYSGWF